jgi:hypothetical protein
VRGYIRRGTPDRDWGFRLPNLSEYRLKQCYAKFREHCVERHDLRETDASAIYKTKLPASISAFAKIVVSGTATRQANLSRLYRSVRMLSIGLSKPFTAPEISTLRPEKISVQDSTGSVRI